MQINATALGVRRGALTGVLGRELAAPGAFLAAILASNYALAALPNVKLFDLLVFAAGYTLGVRRGATVAVGAWFVYGQANPWGYAQPSLLATLMASEVGYAVAGALLARVLPAAGVRLAPSLSWVGFAAAAVAATLFYDIATNVYTGVFWAGLAGSSDTLAWVRVSLLNPGALFFAAVHLSANVIFFTAFGPPLVKVASAARRRWSW